MIKMSIRIIAFVLSIPYTFNHAHCMDDEAAGVTTNGGVHHNSPVTVSSPDKTTQNVITFGTFDLFHEGHLNIILRALALTHGGKLIVGVSSDDVNFQKKSRKSIIDESRRLKIVQNIKGVSEAFLATKLDKRDDIIRWQADIIVVGDDHLGKFDHYQDCVKVVYLPRTSDVSTTEIIENIIKTSPHNCTATCPSTRAFIPHHYNPDISLTLYQLVRDFQGVMDKYHIPFFFNGGTLLGALRHGGIIPWDDDSDCILLEENEEEFVTYILPDLIKYGYEACYIDGDWLGYRVRPWNQGKTITYLDIFIMKFDPNQEKYTYPKGWPGVSPTKEDIFPLKKAAFGNVTINIPNNAAWYLTEKYGREWRTHARKWNHTFNICEKESSQLAPQDLLPAGPFGPLLDVARPYRPLAITLLEQQKQKLMSIGLFTAGTINLYEGLTSTENLIPFPSFADKTFAYGSADNLHPYRIITFMTDGSIQGKPNHENETTWKVCGSHLFTYHKGGYLTNIFYLFKKTEQSKLALIGHFIPDCGLPVHYLIER